MPFNNVAKNSTSYVNASKSASPFSNISRSVNSTPGLPIGLLLALTFSVEATTTWTNQPKHS